MHNWLRSLALLTFCTLHTSLFISEVQAQEENAAFYIYQNDGHFDGFFYDEVLKIRYSFLDTLGIEHDEVVSQEIVTADSTYRIMLSAIDSVGFVQPQIQYNPRLRNMREEGMLDFLTSKNEETMTLTFSSQMPENLWPKVGDVLVDFDLEELFGGKVKSVSTTGDVTVVCDHLEGVHDIYQQYITVEQYGKNEVGTLVRRRVAGLPELTVGEFPAKTRRKSEGEYDFNIFNFSVSGHYPVYTSPGGDVNISVDADINVAVDVKAVWNFPVFGADYLSVTTTLNNDIGLGFTLDGKINDIYPLGLVPYGGFPIPANCPLFVIDFGPDIFLGGDYHAKLNFQTPKFKGKLWGKLELAGDFSSPKLNFGFGTPPGEQEPDANKEEEDNKWSGSIEFNGYEQCGVMTHFSFGASKLLSWALNTSVEFTTYIGPKVSGALNFSISNVMQDQMSAYNLLKDTKLTFSPLGASYEAKATMKTLFTQAREWTLADGSFNMLGDIDLFLFPDFEISDISSRWNSGRYEITSQLKPSRNILFPVNIGVGVYKHGQFLSSQYMKYDANGKHLPNEYTQYNSAWKEAQSGSVQNRVDEAGKYELRPMIMLGGVEMPASQAEEVIIEGPYIDILPYSELTPLITLESGTTEQNILYETNCEDMTLERKNGGVGSQQFQFELKDGSVVAKVGPLHGILWRSAVFTLAGKYKDKDTGETRDYTLPSGVYVEQKADGQFNRCAISSLDIVACTATSSGDRKLVTGHKDAAPVEKYPLPADGYDIQLEILGANKISGTVKRISPWKGSERVVTEYIIKDALLISSRYYNSGYCSLAGVFTKKTTVNRVVYDQETDTYRISGDEETTVNEVSWTEYGFSLYYEE